MCMPVMEKLCNCTGTCGCMSALSVEEEIRLLEASKQRMQVQLAMTERRIGGLKKST